MSQPTRAALAVDDVTVRYGALTALTGLSFEVLAGTILGIIGPNGAGKSSAFAGITNAVRKEGFVRLFGEDVSAIPTQQLARRGLRRTFQQNSFFSGFTVLENAMAAFEVDRGVSLVTTVFAPWREISRRGGRRRDAVALLDDFGIPKEFHDLRPDDLPHGMQRSLSVVLSYGAGARVLLVDEPAAGVGGEDMKFLVRLLDRLRGEGVAIVLIEHHMDLVMDVVDSLLVIDRGRTIARGEPGEVQRDPEVLAAYLGRTA
jgi:branched-chain amino acid transport system ATP-binding protein